ncbi:MAG: hypothetical protein U0169_09965 [Polyangiaceae bacterium]
MSKRELSVRFVVAALVLALSPSGCIELANPKYVSPHLDVDASVDRIPAAVSRALARHNISVLRIDAAAGRLTGRTTSGVGADAQRDTFQFRWDGHGITVTRVLELYDPDSRTWFGSDEVCPTYSYSLERELLADVGSELTGTRIVLDQGTLEEQLARIEVEP